jgi:hypothetical protein
LGRKLVPLWLPFRSERFYLNLFNSSLSTCHAAGPPCGDARVCRRKTEGVPPSYALQTEASHHLVDRACRVVLETMV